MNKQSQKEAVYTAVMSVLKENGITISEGQNVSSIMTKELRSQVNGILVEGFTSGTIELGREFSGEDLRNYASGLQSNWLRKDKRLNGGIAYVAKNPGSRAGSQDAQLKSLRALLTQPGLSDADKAEVQTYIDKRVSEISAAKVKTPTVDYSALPAELQAKFQKQ